MKDVLKPYQAIAERKAEEVVDWVVGGEVVTNWIADLLGSLMG